MNSNCPACEAILRNPRMCPCGWVLSERQVRQKPINKGRDSEEYRMFRAIADRLANKEPYEPGAEG